MLRKLESFRLDGVVQRMRCAFLLTHGAEDEEGGSQHCQRDYLTHGASVIFDWLAEKL